MQRKKGFTLIELLVTIAIIGILSSIVLVSTDSAKLKAQDAAALSTATSLSKVIDMCDLDGGKINVPSVGANICNLGASYGTYPLDPKGWAWYPQVWIDNKNNLMYMTSTSNGNRMHCGHYPPWTLSTCSNPAELGLCKMVQGFGCSMYNASTGVWQ